MLGTARVDDNTLTKPTTRVFSDLYLQFPNEITGKSLSSAVKNYFFELCETKKMFTYEAEDQACT